MQRLYTQNLEEGKGLGSATSLLPPSLLPPSLIPFPQISEAFHGGNGVVETSG